MGKLITRNIFIDTSIFCREGFNFSGHKLNKIFDLGFLGQINILLTEISLQETKIHFAVFIDEIQRSHSSLRRKLSVFSEFPKYFANSLFNANDEETAQCFQEAKVFLDAFLNDLIPEVISVSQVDPAKVFELYFSSKPPFGTGKKKNEFPDAFSLLSLEEWCKKENEKIYVISIDKDMELYCADSDNLIYLSDLSHFLDLINSEESQLSKFSKTWFFENQDLLTDEVVAVAEKRIGRTSIAVNNLQILSTEIVDLKLGKDIYTTLIDSYHVYASVQVAVTLTLKGICEYSHLPSQFDLPTKLLESDNGYASLSATWSLDREIEIEWIRGEKMEELRFSSVSLIGAFDLDLEKARRVIIKD